MTDYLSIFLENSPRKLDKITGLLAKQEISILAISVASAGDFGILKLLVDKPQEAITLLKENKITVSVKKILIVLVEDKPGGLFNLLTLLSDNNINVEDTYGFVLPGRNQAAILLELDELSKAESLIAGNEFSLLKEDDLYAS